MNLAVTWLDAGQQVAWLTDVTDAYPGTDNITQQAPTRSPTGGKTQADLSCVVQTRPTSERANASSPS